MTPARELLARLRERGVHLDLRRDGRVWVKPLSKLTAEELAELRSRRQEIIEEIARGHVVAEPEGAPSGATATSWPSPTCASCGTMHATVYIQMQPGPDGRSWAMCARCWRSR